MQPVAAVRGECGDLSPTSHKDHFSNSFKFDKKMVRFSFKIKDFVFAGYTNKHYLRGHQAAPATPGRKRATVPVITPTDLSLLYAYK